MESKTAEPVDVESGCVATGGWRAEGDTGENKATARQKECVLLYTEGRW